MFFSKNTFLIFAVLLSGSATWFLSRNIDAGRDIPFGSSVGLVVENSSYDFGSVETGEIIFHEFKLHNPGKNPVKIKSVKPSCGCTQYKISPKLVEPGGSTTLKVVVDLRRRTGDQNVDVLVTTDAPQNQRHRFELYGKSFSRVLVEPSSVAFGDVNHTELLLPEVDVTVKGTDGLEFDVLASGGTDNYLTGDVREAGPEGTFKVRLHFKKRPPAGAYSGAVYLKTDHKGAYQTISIPARAYFASGNRIEVGNELKISGATLDGETLDESIFTDHLNIVAFWSGSCGHCRRELPGINQLLLEYRDQGLQVLGVNTDLNQKSIEAANKELDLDFPSIFSAQKQDSSLADQFEIRGIPAVFLVDGSGKVIDVNLRGEALRNRVTELIKSHSFSSTQK